MIMITIIIIIMMMIILIIDSNNANEVFMLKQKADHNGTLTKAINLFNSID